MANAFKTLFQSPDSKHCSEIFSFNKKKFKIDVVHENGAPCGFNYKCCLSVMRDDGSFEHVVDNKMIGFKYKNYYFLDDNDKNIIDINNNASKAFKDFVKKVYT